MNIHSKKQLFVENKSSFWKMGKFGIVNDRALGNYVAESSVINDTFRIKCYLHEIWNRFYPIMGKYL